MARTAPPRPRFLTKADLGALGSQLRRSIDHHLAEAPAAMPLNAAFPVLLLILMAHLADLTRCSEHGGPVGDVERQWRHGSKRSFRASRASQEGPVNTDS